MSSGTVFITVSHRRHLINMCHDTNGMKPISTVTAEALADAFDTAVKTKRDFSVSIVQDSRTFRIENRLVEGRRCTMFAMSDEYLFPPSDVMHINWVRDIHTLSRSPRDFCGQSVIELVVETIGCRISFEVKDQKAKPKVGFQEGYPPRVPSHIDRSPAPV